ncbi:MAG: class I SAM-dependent methyltransferase [Desulfobacterales bacterium]|jgi:SAM-dependent methyltransferase
MAAWIWIFIILAGGLFALKIIFVLSIALVLPVTQGALYVSTSRAKISAFINAVPMTSDQKLVDLGCGDGRVLREAQKRYGVRTVGYEINPLAYLKARLFSFGSNKIKIRRQNFWEADLSDVDVVFCYLYPDVMKRLAAKLVAGMKPGAVIVSSNFTLPGLVPSKIVRLRHSLHNDPIFIYRIKLGQS